MRSPKFKFLRLYDHMIIIYMIILYMLGACKMHMHIVISVRVMTVS